MTRRPSDPSARRRAIAAFAALALPAAAGLRAGPAAAQPAGGFPARPVRIVVPQAPGGASDALARIVAARLAERWGQGVVVENRAGAGGNLGTEAVAKSPADGHTGDERLRIPTPGRLETLIRAYADGGLPLPPEKYDTWRVLDLVFDANGMRAR